VRTTPGGLRGLLTTRPLAADVLLAVLLAAASVWGAVLVDPALVTREAGRPVGMLEPDGLSLALVALACLPVALRRYRPYLMLVLSLPSQLALYAMGYFPSGSVVAGLVLIYTLAAHRGLALSALGVATAFAAFLACAALDPGGVVWADYAISLLLLAGVWVAGRSVRLRRAYLAELEDRADRLERARDADRRAARVEERSRIARELHDVVAHHVSVMTVQAAAARKVLVGNPDAARDALSAIEEMGRTAMAEMRNIVGVLRMDDDEAGGERAPQPGVQDLPTLVEQMREAGLRTQLWVEGERAALPPGVDLAAYRLVQEALTNSLRHAGPAARAWVTVRHDPRELSVQVEDDGQGTASAPRQPRRRPGHGLVGIRERVALYGGVLRIGPRQGGGFEVRARFPLKD
jgi:signal transduction histidine kinase